MKKSGSLRKLIFLFFLVLACFAVIKTEFKFFFAGYETWEKKEDFPPGRRIVKEFTFVDNADLGNWEEKKLSSGRTKYSIAEYAGKNCVRADSDDSASALYYKTELKFTKDPFLSWDWTPVRFPGRKHPETLDKKKEFDFVAQVYVIFASKFFLKTRAIQYVWAKDAPVGAKAYNPYTSNVRIIVLESGETGEWRHEDRDIRSDYRELFGEELQKDVAAVSFMTDSDSTGDSAEAYYTNIVIGYMEAGHEASLKDMSARSGEKGLISGCINDLMEIFRSCKEALRAFLKDKTDKFFK
ncbi:MAG: DUF3047 domain-containing protein [Candidatus Omnitrophota bacterium]